MLLCSNLGNIKRSEHKKRSFCLFKKTKNVKFGLITSNRSLLVNWKNIHKYKNGEIWHIILSGQLTSLSLK